MKFIHIADIHVGMGFSTASFGVSKGTERRREIKETLIRVIKQCEVDHVDLLLIAGDMFEDDYVSLSELKDINHSFSQLTHTKVVMSAGNHDPIMDGRSPFRLIDWCDHVYLFDVTMTSVYFQEINTEVYGFSWQEKHLGPFDPATVKKLDSSRNNILMLHGDVYQENDYQYIDPSAIQPLGFDYVALGHIHKTDFVQPWLAYPGSLEPLDFSETGEHGYIEGDISDKILQARFKAFSKRQFHRIDVEVDGTLSFEGIFDKVSDLLANYKKTHFFRISLVGDVDPMVDVDIDQMKDRLSGLYYYTEIRDKLELDLDIERLRIEYEGSLIGHYIQQMLVKDQEDPIVKQALKQGIRLLLEEQVRL